MADEFPSDSETPEPGALQSADVFAFADPEDETAEENLPPDPGRLRRWLDAFVRWHPYIFMGLAAVLAGIAWIVYPRPEERQVTPAETYYYDGLDRLFRVINPDLPLVAAAPADEALAARSAFLNLMIFHRDNLRSYPSFINPHLLLAESNRILAEFSPDLARRYYADAAGSYADAAVWEWREDTPHNMAVYLAANFLDDSLRLDPAGDAAQDEIAFRRARRDEYIRFRQAEANIILGRPELARAPLEDIQRASDSRRREHRRRTVLESFADPEVRPRLFELGLDDYRRLDLLLARAYDGLGDLDTARGWYLRFLASEGGGREHAFVVERLAGIALADGEVYRRADPDRAAALYQEAVRYYQELLQSPSLNREQLYGAVNGLAAANSRLADLVPDVEKTGIDELGEAARTVQSWLEDFSGQPLPGRTLALPMALGTVLSRPELTAPGANSVPAAVGGTLTAMAAGKMVTPYSRRRAYLSEALRNYDRMAGLRPGTPEGDRARVNAAWESWQLGLKQDTERRLERLIDPLSGRELILAARLGLSLAALDRGDLRRAHRLVLGGYASAGTLWFTPTDADWRRIAVGLGTPANRAGQNVWRRVWESISPEGREIAAYAASGRRLDDDYVGRFLRALNTMLRDPGFYIPEFFPASDRNRYLTYLLERDPDLLTEDDLIWRNRLLLEESWPYDLSQRAGRSGTGFEPFPPGREIEQGGLLDIERIRSVLIDLARAWITAADSTESRPDRLRMITEATEAYEAALNQYGADPGEILYELARSFEALAEIREVQGEHMKALSLTAKAARTYLDVSFRARGTSREMEALLAAGDAFFRSGLLERTAESQRRFLERFGYSSIPGSDSASMVVRAENLLGRAYWFMNDIPRAIDSFTRNIARRTPDRYKSMYYIGRVLMDEGIFRDDPELLGDVSDPLPELDRNGDPRLRTALQAFNYLRQGQGINPSARAWRWATFDLAKLHYVFAERMRRAAERGDAPAAETGSDALAGEESGMPWLARYETARDHLTEALERYPLNISGGPGVSLRIEPEDYADVMASRFETEFLLANTLFILAEARQDDALFSLARAHLENLRDRNRYAEALFDTTLDRFQLNSAVIREAVDGGNWDRSVPLPRSRLGDDEGPTHDPVQLRGILANSMLLLASDYFRAGEKASQRLLIASAEPAAGSQPSGAADGYYRDAYRTYQDLYDRFGAYYGPQAMVGMGDALGRLNYPEDAGNHYRMARNMVDLLPAAAAPVGTVDAGPAFWGAVAEQRLRDMAGGYPVP